MACLSSSGLLASAFSLGHHDCCIHSFHCVFIVSIVAQFTWISAGNWLGLRLDVIGTLVAFCVALIAVIRPDLIPPGW